MDHLKIIQEGMGDSEGLRGPDEGLELLLGERAWRLNRAVRFDLMDHGLRFDTATREQIDASVKRVTSRDPDLVGKYGPHR